MSKFTAANLDALANLAAPASSAPKRKRGPFTVSDLDSLATAPPPPKPTTWQAVKAGVAQGARDVMGAPLEAAAWIDNRLGGNGLGTPATVRAWERQALDQYHQEYAHRLPAELGRFGTDMAAVVPMLDAGGALVGSAADAAGVGDSGVARFLAGRAGNAASLGGLGVRGASLAARGALEGAGANALVGASPRQGAILGGMAAPALGAIGSIGGSVADRVMSHLQTPAAAKRAALTEIAKNLARDGLDPISAAQRAQALGPLGTVADLDGNIGRLGEVVAQTPGSGSEMARRVLEERQQGQPDRLIGAVQRGTGATSDFHSLFDAIRANQERLSQPLYDRSNFTHIPEGAYTDENGVPVRVYHGTAVDFDKFDDGQRGATTRAKSAARAHFFTDNPELAGDYAVELGDAHPAHRLGALRAAADRARELALTRGDPEDWDAYTEADDAYEAAKDPAGIPEGANIRPHYLRMENPYVRETHGERYDDAKLSRVLREAAKKGHDGVILRNYVDPAQNPAVSEPTPSTVYGVFDSANVLPGMARAPRMIPVDDRLAEFLRDPDVRTGLAEGAKIARRDATGTGRAFDPAAYALGEDLPEQMPMHVLDTAKKGLDELIEKHRDTATGKLAPSGEVRSLVGLKKRYVDALDAANPDYRAARQAWAGASQAMDAMNMGRRFLQNEPELTAKVVKDMSPSERQFFKAGVQKSLLDKIQSAPDGVSLPKRVFGNETLRGKIRAAFDDNDAFDAFQNAMENEATMTRTYQRSLGNSATARRLMAAQDAGFPMEPVIHAARGDLLSAAHGTAMHLVNALTGPSEIRSAQMANYLFGPPEGLPAAFAQPLRGPIGRLVQKGGNALTRAAPVGISIGLSPG